MPMRDFYFPAIVNDQPWQRWQRAVVDAFYSRFEGVLADGSPPNTDRHTWQRRGERKCLATAAVGDA